MKNPCKTVFKKARQKFLKVENITENWNRYQSSADAEINKSIVPWTETLAAGLKLNITFQSKKTSLEKKFSSLSLLVSALLFS